VSSKTIVRENKIAKEGEVQHYFCPYCSKYLNPDEVKELRCKGCKTYLVGDATTGGLFIEEK
jgi:hypothetical protein